MAASLAGLGLLWISPLWAQEPKPAFVVPPAPALALPPAPIAVIPQNTKPAPVWPTESTQPVAVITAPGQSAPPAVAPSKKTLIFTKEAGIVAPSWPTPAAQSNLNFSKDAISPAPEIRPVMMQMPPAGPGLARPGSEEASEYQIQLEPPGPNRLFRLDSEETLHERMRQEARQRSPMERISFPEEPIVSKGTYAGRQFPEQKLLVEPNYVCYGRLNFEEKNSERYGWDLGVASPIVSAGKFYWDVVTLPYHAFTDPCRKSECSAGYCLPGDPVPYLLYPPQFSWTGLLAEAGAGVGAFAIFP